MFRSGKPKLSLTAKNVSIFENVSVFVPVPDKLKNILEIHTTQKETEKETVKTVDPDILKRIKEMKENG